MEENYKPNYLKLVSKKDVSIHIGSEINSLKRSLLPFGLFSKELFNSGETRWAIVRFDPYSKDTGFDNEFSKREDALTAATKYLEKTGFEVTQFDLEGLIDSL